MEIVRVWELNIDRRWKGRRVREGKKIKQKRMVFI